jgi:hypothetical protein
MVAMITKMKKFIKTADHSAGTIHGAIVKNPIKMIDPPNE